MHINFKSLTICFKKFFMDKYEEILIEYEIQVERALPFTKEFLKKNETIKKYEEEIICKSDINYDARNAFLWNQSVYRRKRIYKQLIRYLFLQIKDYKSGI